MDFPRVAMGAQLGNGVTVRLPEGVYIGYRLHTRGRLAVG